MKVQHWRFAKGLVALGCLLAASVQAATVLERVSAGGKLVIAHRESSVPFSYVDSQSGKPVGYAVDLCLRMAEVVRKKTGKKDMEVEFVAVTPANRITMIEQGKADMECGSTTNNAERRQKVAFTIPHFITGARLMVRRDSAVDRVDHQVAHLYDPLHPAVLRLVFEVISSAEKAGVPVSVCGEMAGDIRLTRLLLGMGLTQYSMHPSQLLDVKELLLKTDFEATQKLVKKVTRTFDIDKIDALMRQLHED